MGFGEIHEASFQSTSTGTRVDYRVLTPPSWRDADALRFIGRALSDPPTH
ncbi:hypothetical protein [Streptosporangium sp. NPDC002607]